MRWSLVWGLMTNWNHIKGPTANSRNHSSSFIPPTTIISTIIRVLTQQQNFINMQAVAVFLVAALAVASAGIVAPVVHSVPIVQTHAVPVVHAAPVVKTVVPVASSSSFNYRAPAAKVVVPVATPVVHHVQPVVRAVPVVHASPIVHAAPVLVH